MNYRQQLEAEISILESQVEKERRPAAKALLQSKLRSKIEQLQDMKQVRNEPESTPPRQH